MISTELALTEALKFLPQTWPLIASKRHQFVKQIQDCLFFKRTIIPQQTRYVPLIPNLLFSVEPDLRLGGMNTQSCVSAHSENTITISRDRYTHRYMARSYKITNLLTVNQKQLWEQLGWSSTNAVSILTAELATNWHILSPILALCIILKDFKGFASHEFNEEEAKVLFTLYDLNWHTGKSNFSKTQINNHYNAVFGQKLSKQLLDLILTQLVNLSVTVRKGKWHFLNEAIRLESRFDQ